MSDLAELVTGIARDLFGYRGKVVHQASREADYMVDNPNRRCPVITKARQEIGYDPIVPLEEGLRRSMIWYRENCEAEEA
jgi:UDP-glucuronate decarboxylase